MTQRELNQAVARATGESLGTVSNMGFGMADPMDVNYDPEPPSEEIEDRIRRAGMAAQLFAAAEVLDELEGGRTAAEKQYAYITERYPDTEQATLARRRLKERSEP